MRIPSLFSRSRSEGWLVTALGETSARFAHVRPGARPRVLFLEERSWGAADAKGLEKVSKSLRASSFRCTTLLPQSDYQVLLLESPPGVKRDELKAALRWKLKDMIDFPVDAATFDILDLPAPPEGAGRPATLYVVVARNDTVKGVMERFRGARIPLSVIDIPDAAQRNIAALYESEQRGLLTLSFGRDGGLLTITARGELLASRRLDTAFDHVNGADEAARARAFDRVLVEVQRSLDHFERNFTQTSVEKVLVAPMAQAAALVGHLAAQVSLPVAAIDLAEVMDLPERYAGLPPNQQGEWLRLIGAGLREEARP
jgi:MSHA biogenesis protein MshI